MEAYFLAATVPIGLVFVFYPIYLWVAAKLSKTNANQPIKWQPQVAILIAVRNGEKLIEAKLNNCLNLDYPNHLMHIYVACDGCTDNTAQRARSMGLTNLTLIEHEHHIGKAAALNDLVSYANEPVLIFSDTDALLQPNAIQQLTDSLAPQYVGGVCGLRQLKHTHSGMQHSQQKYVSLDSWIKQQESKLGFLTSNDGKLYAIKREYFSGIKEAVTDDLYNCLSVQSKNTQFIFNENAIAYITTPAKNEAHEISRRRRITCRSFTGIFSFKNLLTPVGQVHLAIGLWCNKVARRCLPFSLLAVFAGSIAFASSSLVVTVLLILQLLIYVTVLVIYITKPTPSKLNKLGYAAMYFTLGNIGMLLGVIDFLANKKISKWEPIKND